MQVVVVGAGAVGGSMAVKLADAGHTVGVVARGAHLQAIRAQGLTLYDPAGAVTVPLQASDRPEDFGPQDLIVLGVKAHQIGPLLPRLRSMLRHDTVVLPAINGLPWWYFHGDVGARQPAGSPARIACLDPDGHMDAALDAAHIVGCVVHGAAEVTAPGTITANGQYRYVIGEPRHEPSARVDALADALRAAGCDPQPTARIRDAIWMKLIGNAAFNPVAALTRARMDQICASPGLLGLVRGIMLELIALTHAYGCDPQVDADTRIAIGRGIGPVKPSTLQDLERGHALEVDPLLGAPVELARRAGFAMPLTEAMLALLAELDRRVVPDAQGLRSGCRGLG
ncbi:MAG: 2-dehydropantoate 2-reductase [Betaproteobacteria bacterium]|jgi:2-dehydropantoate 2-reductase|nr:2-dehydropantoate 2-reductase [Betaproteobacteria bacterium]OZB44474.1 MAG: 2-dehydropantoate 2-reductase [Thiomonas sp. 15-66-11]OZB65839.1 MAG: 2-dehydropantoate 2-reductase [Thiomonas sp. 13-66-29]